MNKTNFYEFEDSKNRDYQRQNFSSRRHCLNYLRYIDNIKLLRLMTTTFAPFPSIGNKGLYLRQFLMQMLAFFIDGTNMSMSNFDNKKKEPGYAAILENDSCQMASSHQMKRFFMKFIPVKDEIYNKIPHELFIWRLLVEKPKIIVLGTDTMVMDNDCSNKKEGNEPTCKKKKGFQHLFMFGILFKILYIKLLQDFIPLDIIS